jgi:hypothetical protein
LFRLVQENFVVVFAYGLPDGDEALHREVDGLAQPLFDEMYNIYKKYLLAKLLKRDLVFRGREGRMVERDTVRYII